VHTYPTSTPTSTFIPNNRARDSFSGLIEAQNSIKTFRNLYEKKSNQFSYLCRESGLLPIQKCKVSFVDRRSVCHSVEVQELAFWGLHVYFSHVSKMAGYPPSLTNGPETHSLWPTFVRTALHLPRCSPASPSQPRKTLPPQGPNSVPIDFGVVRELRARTEYA